jgi:hypothetical protein
VTLLTDQIEGFVLGPPVRYGWTGIGGGAVGEAPYSIHRQDCTPAHLTGTPFNQFGGVAILRYYGPVFTLADPSVTVYARPTNSPYPWGNITSDFIVQTNYAGNLRDVGIKQKPGPVLIGFAAGYEYQVFPVTQTGVGTTLRCLLVTGSPAVRAASDEYLHFWLDP